MNIYLYLWAADRQYIYYVDKDNIVTTHHSTLILSSSRHSGRLRRASVSTREHWLRAVQVVQEFSLPGSVLHSLYSYQRCLHQVDTTIIMNNLPSTTDRMAVTLWSIQTPGTAQLERDINVMNNKKKVVTTPCPWILVSIMLFQVIKMLMVVVALFTLAWLPLQLYDVLNQMVPEINM